MHPVRAIAGLGNPGPEYVQTRHNIGFELIDLFAARHNGSFKENKKAEALVSEVSMDGQKITLIKPLTFMNRSGKSIGHLARYFNWLPEQIAVVYDDITLDLARIKLSMQGSAGGHNGVADILSRFGNGFVRVRIGIGSKTPPDMDLADYVLGQFGDSDRKQIEAHYDHYLQAIDSLIQRGPEATMSQFNQKPKS